MALLFIAKILSSIDYASTETEEFAGLKTRHEVQNWAMRILVPKLVELNIISLDCPLVEMPVITPSLYPSAFRESF